MTLDRKNVTRVFLIIILALPISYFWLLPLFNKIHLPAESHQPLPLVTCDGQPLDYLLTCDKCAYVTGSGHLLHSGRGQEINKHDCIIRSNLAPTLGYERDVGNRTTVRTTDLSSLREGKDRKDLFGKARDGTLVTVFYHHKQAKFSDAQKKCHEFKKLWPNIKVAIIDEELRSRIYESFTKNIQELSENVWVSNGFSTILFAKEICNEVHVYGISDPGYCERIKQDKTTKDVPYHYHGHYKETECELFRRHSKKATWGHKFVEEKEMFQKWTKEWQLVFHQPEWPRPTGP